MHKLGFAGAFLTFAFLSLAYGGPQLSCVYHDKSPRAIEAKCGGASCGSAYVCIGIVDCTE